MKRKIALFLSALFICTALSGCEKEPEVPLNDIFEKGLEINGVSYSLPLTPGDFDEDYRCERITIIERPDYNLYYKGDLYSFFTLSSQEEVDFKERIITDISFLNGSYFRFGEICYGATKERIEKAHGEPDVINGYNLYETSTSEDDWDFLWAYYFLGDSTALQIQYTDDKVTFISFNFDGKIKEAVLE